MISQSRTYSDFNPRSPCGERRLACAEFTGKKIFQSTLSVWRATYKAVEICDLGAISIHALRVESDLSQIHINFALKAISIHALRVESDLTNIINHPLLAISIHALRVESDWEYDITIPDVQ